MRFLAFAVALSGVAGAVLPAIVAAQTPTAPSPAVGSTLSLGEAIALARRNSPTFQTSVTARRTVAAQLRQATGALLPSLSSGFSGDYREGKQQIVSGQAFGSTNSALSTNAQLSASYSISPSAFADRQTIKRNVEATETDITAAEQTLRNNIVVQFVAVLQSQATARLQDTLLTTTDAQLQLAQAKLQVGTATQLDVDRADVANGLQRVAALRAHNDVDIQKLRLFQQIGIEPVMSTTLDSLPTGQMPAQNVTELVEMARKSNPVLEGARLREEAAASSVTSARRAYFPSFSLSAGLSGYTNRYTNTDALIASSQAGYLGARTSCIRSEEVRAALNLSNTLAACQSIAFTDAQAAQIRDAQSKYPFGFARNPYSLSAALSLPIFNGFRREANIETANVQRRNQQLLVRAQELQLNADVTTASLNLSTSQEALRLQVLNAATARRALALAQARYAVGTISLVDLIQARSDFDTAETSRITATYDFQRAFAALEVAVGRPLR
jgi:outer membrane protein